MTALFRLVSIPSRSQTPKGTVAAGVSAALTECGAEGCRQGSQRPPRPRLGRAGLFRRRLHLTPGGRFVGAFANPDTFALAFGKGTP